LREQAASRRSSIWDILESGPFGQAPESGINPFSEPSLRPLKKANADNSFFSFGRNFSGSRIAVPLQPVFPFPAAQSQFLRRPLAAVCPHHFLFSVLGAKQKILGLIILFWSCSTAAVSFPIPAAGRTIPDILP
jgi:hypothetical protein